MRSACAILTYRRLPALQETLRGLEQHCSHYPLAVFNDMGQRDGTEAFLSMGRVAKLRPDLMAVEMVLTPEAAEAGRTEEEKLLGAEKLYARHFLGTKNLGVAGNSNRALKWLMEETDADHFCLMNDDLHVLKNFVAYYASGHADLGVGMFCFCPSGGIYDHESYKWVTVRSRGYGIRLMPRLTGIMMSVTRKLVEQIGYFDTRFGSFGNEHCDWTYRARFAGGICLDGQSQNCLDLEPGDPMLQHQDVETCMTGVERQQADQESVTAMAAASARYAHEHYYRPFSLVTPKWAGSFAGFEGIPFDALPGYKLVGV